MTASPLILDGAHLTVEDIYSLATNPKRTVSIAPSARKKVLAARAFLEKVSSKKIIYGINTGFGPMSSHVVSQTQITELQYNLVRSHATGMGEPVEQRFVLGAMVVRLNTLLKGYSGVTWELIEQYVRFINARIIPVVPEHGAVGTSGDLVQLAHIALALIGEGEVWHENRRRSTKAVLKQLGIKPHELKSKEGLALINGTAMMTGIAAFLVMESAQLINIAVRMGGLALELVHAFQDGISEELHAARPHYGQKAIAKLLRETIQHSTLIRPRSAIHKGFEASEDVQRIPQIVQEVYSLRCIPQIIGPVFDTLRKAWCDIEVEMNSATDNPLLDVERQEFLHGGNFHGDYVATAVDQLKAGITKLTMLFERQINFFLSEHVSRSFPPFLNRKKPGLTLSLQALQFVATSTTAQNQSLAFPHSIHSIPTNADNQDVVSMGTDAALMANKVLENAYIVAAIEAITLAQAVDCHDEQAKLGTASKALFKEVRSIFKVVEEDRFMSPEAQALSHALKDLFFDPRWFRPFVAPLR